jgi:hypothetical protein
VLEVERHELEGPSGLRGLRLPRQHGEAVAAVGERDLGGAVKRIDLDRFARRAAAAGEADPPGVVVQAMLRVAEAIGQRPVLAGRLGTGLAALEPRGSGPVV